MNLELMLCQSVAGSLQASDPAPSKEEIREVRGHGEDERECAHPSGASLLPNASLASLKLSSRPK